jgi:hypothetical protein
MFDLIQRFSGITYSRQQCQYPSEGSDVPKLIPRKPQEIRLRRCVREGFAWTAFAKMDVFARLRCYVPA